MMLNVVTQRPRKAPVSGLCASSAEEQRGWLTLSQDADVILISLGSNSLNFLSPSSPPQLNITFPLKRPSSNRSHSSLFLAAETSGSDAFQCFVPAFSKLHSLTCRVFSLGVQYVQCCMDWRFLVIRVTIKNSNKGHLVYQLNMQEYVDKKNNNNFCAIFILQK